MGILRLFVGGLSYDTVEAGLRRFFEAEGYEVSAAEVIVDRVTSRSKGFGFVNLVVGNKTTDSVVQEFHGRKLDGRKVTVNEAVPKTKKVEKGAGQWRD